MPLELITMLGSGLFGAIIKLWSQHLKARHAQHSQLLQSRDQQAGHFKEARELKDRGFQITRRIIALTAVFSVVLLPKIVVLFWPDVSVMVGYTEIVTSGFWIFSSESEVIKWVALNGLVLTPLDTHLMSSIIGLYFGGTLARW